MPISLKVGKDDASCSPLCRCLEPQYTPRPQQRWRELNLHQEQQDTNCEAWTRLLELVEAAAKDGREELAPRRELGAELWREIVTLPATISKLTSVKHLYLYGSALVRIPPEIGHMSALEEFTPYTSYRLHWFPYEIMRCRLLRKTIVSTRALYGNYKFRPPFPRLPHLLKDLVPQSCSVCDGVFGPSGPLPYWVTRRDLPLLVHACSMQCLERIPAPYFGYYDYIPGPHQGGLGLEQPETEYELRSRPTPDFCRLCGKSLSGGCSITRSYGSDGRSQLVYKCLDGCSDDLPSQPP